MASNLVRFDSLLSDKGPELRYKRMENDVTNILRRDAASCICVCTKFICIGTQSGTVHLLDHEGNAVSAGTRSPEDRKEFQAHTMAVNQISIDQSGDYIATCSDDGKAVVYGLYSSENNQSVTNTCKIKSIALDPLYSKPGSGRRFLTGDTELTMTEKTLMIRSRKTALYKNEGYVRNIAWKGRFVAWASDLGVRVFDVIPKCCLGLVKWDRNVPTAIEDYRCNLIWAAENTLMIGWFDTVKICVVRKSTSTELRNGHALQYSVDIMYTFQTNYYICGLGPFGERLVLLGLPKYTVTGKSQGPILCIADYKEHEYTEVSRDGLAICVYDEYCCNDYHLDQLIEENRFFIVSPKAVIVASPYDTDDKVDWLLNNRKYSKAVSFLVKSGGKTRRHSVSDVGSQYLDHLLEQKLFKDAAVVCAKVCRKDKALWESYILKFHKCNQLRIISHYVPTKLENKMSPFVYEMILNEYLTLDLRGFLRFVQDWNPVLYDTTVIKDSVINHLLSHLDDACNRYVLEALALLYCYKKQFDEALKIYIKLKHKDIFTIMRNHNMYGEVADNVLPLMKLGCEETISILLEKCNVSPDAVERQLIGNDSYLFRYLDAYNEMDTEGLYQEKLVRLYAKYAREKLLPLLKYGRYNMQEALEVCQSYNLYPEIVCLLGRSGNTKEALQMILQKLGDVNQAICFCQEHNDMELWIDLINYSVEKPEYVTLLLKQIGNFVDPTVLIERIKPETEIQNLRDSLIKLLHDYHLQLTFHEANRAILLREYFGIHEKFIRNHNAGISISEELLCSACRGKIFLDDLSHTSNLRVYNCRHVYHTGCLPDNLQIKRCPLCNAV